MSLHIRAATSDDTALIFAFRYEDFTLQGYDPHPHIKAEVAV